MKKLFVYALLAGGIVAAVPPLRAAAAPYAGPVLERAGEAMDPLLMRLLNPVFRWSAQSETDRIARLLRERATFGLALPRPSAFQGFLAEHARSGRAGNDPWGSPYQLRLSFDEATVLSAGPDLVAGTFDDITSTVPIR